MSPAARMPFDSRELLMPSAIWRQPIDGTVYDFFKQISSDLLPWNSNRNTLTPAEALFGAVGAGKHIREDGSEEKVSRNLASRVRFSDARTLPGEVARHSNQIVTLKILGSPKLPSASMYFAPRHAAAQPGRKPALAADAPRGRKVYLPHPKAQTDRQFWKSDSPNESATQKLRVRPLEPGSSFWFHIDFDNLSDAELKLLLTSVSPSPEFQHRLGLGKPLGLGSVRLESAGCYLIDRVARYRDFALGQSRYQFAIVGSIGDRPACFAQRYAAEAAIAPNYDPPSDDSLIDKATLQVLATVGDPARLKPGLPVCYPFAEGQQGDETEGFKWFVNNDDRHNRDLQVLSFVAADLPLPTLKSNRGR